MHNRIVKILKQIDDCVLVSSAKKIMTATAVLVAVFFLTLKQSEIDFKVLLLAVAFYLAYFLWILYLALQSIDSLEVVGVCVQKKENRIINKRLKKNCNTVTCTIKSIAEPFFFYTFSEPANTKIEKGNTIKIVCRTIDCIPENNDTIRITSCLGKKIVDSGSQYESDD